MFTLVIIGLIIYIPFSFLDLHYEMKDTNGKFSLIMERLSPIIACVGACVAIAGPIVSFLGSAAQADQAFDSCTPGRSAFSQGAVVTDGKAFYKVDSNNVLWIPFGLPEYEQCEAPEGACTTCMTMQNTPFCEDCGAKVNQGNNVCVNCGAACSSNFCGHCGTKIDTGE